MRNLFIAFIASLFVSFSFSCSSDPEELIDPDQEQTEGTEEEGGTEAEDGTGEDSSEEGEGTGEDPKEPEKVKSIKVLQLNTWNEGTNVVGGNGFFGIIDEIKRAKPDFVLLCEINNKNDVDFIERLVRELGYRGLEYYGIKGYDTGMISKYPYLETSTATGHGVSVPKFKVKIDNNIYVLYPSHWDYTHYACYLPRGYDGETWEKLPAPITDPKVVEASNKESWRDEAAKCVIDDAKKEKGNIIIIGGDFNEPSHLDWTEETKFLWDHNGAVIHWDCSVLLQEAGFKDSYRELYPNPITHPGFTFPSDNKDIEDPLRLTWAPDADERDRIDFVYYMPHDSIELADVSILGPKSSIVRGKRMKENTQDKFIEPVDLWPTDHKGLIVTFNIK